MKIITWNVNGLRAVERKGEIQKLIEEQQPDILLLQEIKGKREQFSKYLTENEKYQQFYHSATKPGYAGTGIWISRALVQNVMRLNFNMSVPHFGYRYPENDIGSPIGVGLNNTPNMDEGRVSHMSFVRNKKIYDFMSIYFPNGGKSEEAWREKLIFFDKILQYMNNLRKLGHEVIVGGDMNVAHTEIDLARPKENEGNIGFHPDERAWVDRVIAKDWVDIWRTKNPNITDVYSWWDMKTRARSRNVGWRIDYFFIDKSLIDKVEWVKYLQQQMGSDHCPLMVEINI